MNDVTSPHLSNGRPESQTGVASTSSDGGRAFVRVDDAVATVTIDNSGRRNAVSQAIFSDLDRILADLAARAEVRVVVITGRGGDFSVGADLGASPTQRTLRGDSVSADIARLRAASGVAQALHDLPQVTIAAVDGACAGAGLSLAAAVDLRVATDRAVFNTAFLNAGLSGDFGAIWFLTRMLGPSAARRLSFMPEKLTATRAAELGLIDTVTPAAELDDTVTGLTERLAAAAPVALRAMKDNLLRAESMPLTEYLQVEAERMVRCFHTHDAQEAAAAFLEKRPAHFTGC